MGQLGTESRSVNMAIGFNMRTPRDGGLSVSTYKYIPNRLRWIHQRIHDPHDHDPPVIRPATKLCFPTSKGSTPAKLLRCELTEELLDLDLREIGMANQIGVYCVFLYSWRCILWVWTKNRATDPSSTPWKGIRSVYISVMGYISIPTYKNPNEHDLAAPNQTP